RHPPPPPPQQLISSSSSSLGGVRARRRLSHPDAMTAGAPPCPSTCLGPPSHDGEPAGGAGAGSGGDGGHPVTVLSQGRGGGMADCSSSSSGGGAAPLLVQALGRSLPGLRAAWRSWEQSPGQPGLRGLHLALPPTLPSTRPRLLMARLGSHGRNPGRQGSQLPTSPSHTCTQATPAASCLTLPSPPPPPATPCSSSAHPTPATAQAPFQAVSLALGLTTSTADPPDRHSSQGAGRGACSGVGNASAARHELGPGSRLPAPPPAALPLTAEPLLPPLT
ncbi:hypothetical protein V8C86DRAFT_2962979, partial [Haematococcus lacustris]